mmetsp:Transcript_31034/g.104483  ORF Transcript_31034/g.104483 Transcript_31034/m.104483 type:complete len:217 (-) Transcript_31034:708-1358(-)
MRRGLCPKDVCARLWLEWSRRRRREPVGPRRAQAPPPPRARHFGRPRRARRQVEGPGRRRVRRLLDGIAAQVHLQLGRRCRTRHRRPPLLQTGDGPRRRHPRPRRATRPTRPRLQSGRRRARGAPRRVPAARGRRGAAQHGRVARDRRGAVRGPRRRAGAAAGFVRALPRAGAGGIEQDGLGHALRHVAVAGRDARRHDAEPDITVSRARRRGDFQ